MKPVWIRYRKIYQNVWKIYAFPVDIAISIIYVSSFCARFSSLLESLWWLLFYLKRPLHFHVMDMKPIPLHLLCPYHVYNISGIFHAVQEPHIHFLQRIKDGGIDLHREVYLFPVKIINSAVSDRMEILRSIWHFVTLIMDSNVLFFRKLTTSHFKNKLSMLCLSRVTDERYARRFGDGEHKFYFEIRCNQPCVEGRDICKKCEKIYPECKNQFCRYFPHGKVTEPVPERSHIFGGKWYLDHLAEWGEPSQEMVRFAQQHQDAARQGVDAPSKEDKPSMRQEMPRKAKVVLEEPLEKPAAAPVAAPLPKQKRSRKVKIEEEVPLVDESTIEETTPITKPKKKAAPKKKKEETPVVLVHKEVVIPTHKEDTLDEVDTEGYDVEYVKLSPFELDRVSYFRDSKKNKIYKRIKDKIGEYIGRFDPDTESIDADIPDSDDEN